jgi:hypothetical protein
MGDEIKVVPGQRIRTFGGWYRHDVVTLNGREIGRIQTRRRNGRFSTLTAGLGSTCVLGSDVAWLVAQAQGAR